MPSAPFGAAFGQKTPRCHARSVTSPDRLVSSRPFSFLRAGSGRFLASFASALNTQIESASTMPLSSEDWDKAQNKRSTPTTSDPKLRAALLVFAESHGKNGKLNRAFHNLALNIVGAADLNTQRKAIEHLLIARDLLISRLKAKSPKGPYQPPEAATIESLEFDERTARDSVLAVQALHKLGWDIEAALRAVKTVSKCEPCKGEGLVYKPERLKK